MFFQWNSNTLVFVAYYDLQYHTAVPLLPPTRHGTPPR